jgi:hypothetical protein
MWISAIKASQDNIPLMAVVLPPIIHVINLHSIHLAMARRHLPLPIMAALWWDYGSRRWPAGLRQWSCGPQFSLPDSVYGAVLAVALWIAIDLDCPASVFSE